MISARVNTSGLERRLRLARQNADPAGLAVAKDGADVFVGFMVEKAPRDTGRYVAGWVQAGNAAKVGPKRPVPPLRESRWKQKLEDALDRQIDRLVRKLNEIQGVLDSWYFSKGRRLDKFARRKQREAARLAKALERAVNTKRQYLNAQAPVLAFDIFSNGRLVRTDSGKLRQLRQTTVRDKVYGGAGGVVERDGERVVVLHNREPHVTLIERRYRLMSRAHAAVRRHTDARGKRTFTRHLFDAA